MNSEVEDGFIIMEVERKFVTCDEKDIDVTVSSVNWWRKQIILISKDSAHHNRLINYIYFFSQTSTTYLVWSLNDRVKPTSRDSLSQHTHRGSRPVNLFGQSKMRVEPEDADSFILQTKVIL